MDSYYLYFFTVIASTEGFIILSAFIASSLLITRRNKAGAAFIASALGLAVSVILLKGIFQVARPADMLIETTGYAFPSGHAAGVAFLALSLAYLSRRLKPLALRYAIYAAAALMIVAIGASRLHFNAHTLDQVLAGYAVGALWAYLFTRLDHRR